LLGELYLDTAEEEKAIKNPRKAEEMFRDMGIHYWLAMTYALYAELFKRKGDQSKARANLGKAIEILKECGADG
jgi:tetratricopeptide (TPR) repeat protein